MQQNRVAVSESGQSLQIVARRKPLYVCNAPDSDQILPRSGMSLRANKRHRTRRAAYVVNFFIVLFVERLNRVLFV
jgi:hypothetical protein